MKFYKDDYLDFKSWVQFSMGVDPSHRKELVYFFNCLFLDGLDASQIWDRFISMMKLVKSGPLHSWIRMLAHRWICFLFVKKGHAIADYPQYDYIFLNDLMVILRDFLVEKYPDKEQQISDLLLDQSSYFLQKKISYFYLCEEFNLPRNVQGTTDDEWLFSIEIYWTSQWKKLLRYVEDKKQLDDYHRTTVWNKDQIIQILQIIKETFMLLVVTIFVIYSIKNVNQWLENKLEKKIKLFEPSYLWNKNIFSVNTSKDKISSIKQDLIEISKINSLKNIETMQEKEERFEEESDFFDLEQIPSESLGVQNAEQSKENTFAFRDDRFGGNKIYRLMLRGNNLDYLKSKIFDLISLFGAKQIGHFSLNVDVAGGTYFNLYIDKSRIEQFIKSTEVLTYSSVFITKTSKFTPPDKVRVFIWLKNL
jgi:hypothetical protein